MGAAKAVLAAAACFKNRRRDAFVQWAMGELPGVQEIIIGVAQEYSDWTRMSLGSVPMNVAQSYVTPEAAENLAPIESFKANR